MNLEVLATTPTRQAPGCHADPSQSDDRTMSSSHNASPLGSQTSTQACAPGATRLRRLRSSGAPISRAPPVTPIRWPNRYPDIGL